jgi:polyhydroxybutyrate depolymerase
MGRLLRWVLIAVVGLPLLLVAGLVGLVVACTPPQPEAPALPGRVERGGMRHDGLERTWTLYVPAALAESPALLLVLHGSSHDAEMVRRVSLWRFDELAERDGFLVAYPEGLANSGALRLGPEWNDCRKSTRNRAHDLDVDDVGFLRRLIADLSETYRVDRRRVYATGYSDGGQMSYRLATEIPDEIAGVAVVMAQQAEPENSNCLDPRGRISILVMNGTDDPIIPFGGGEASLFGWFSAGRVAQRERDQAAGHLAAPAGRGARRPLLGRAPELALRQRPRGRRLHHPRRRPHVARRLAVLPSARHRTHQPRHPRRRRDLGLPQPPAPAPSRPLSRSPARCARANPSRTGL